MVTQKGWDFNDDCRDFIKPIEKVNAKTLLNSRNIRSSLKLHPLSITLYLQEIRKQY